MLKAMKHNTQRDRQVRVHFPTIIQSTSYKYFIVSLIFYICESEDYLVEKV